MPYADPEKHRKWQREWMARRRAEWIAAHGPCVDCRTWDDLQVDHVDASTKVTHRVWSWAKERREEELAKCTVRCAPCHEAKTTASREDPRGEQHWAAKLKDDQIPDIRASQLSISHLARVYGVSRKAIRNVRQGKTWLHVA
jgi:hypothetical protein